MQNRLTEEAVEAVEALCRNAGWPVERITAAADTVELLARVPSNCRLPPLEVWLAVQGTRKPRKYRGEDGRLHVPVSVADVRRWLDRRAPTFFVLWDLDRKQGAWALPKVQIPEWDLLTGSATQVTLPTEADDPVKPEFMPVIAGMTRVLHFEAIASLSEERDFNDPDAYSLSGPDETTARWPLILAEFLNATRAYDGEALSEPVLAQFRIQRRAAENEVTAENEADELDEDEIDDEADSIEAIDRAIERTVAYIVETETGGRYQPRHLQRYGTLMLLNLLSEAGEIPDPAAMLLGGDADE
jgi:hypothetical protein